MEGSSLQKSSRKKKVRRIRDFRFLLQDELTARCASNANYSLRSFARFLNVAPSALSEMIKGKRPISEKMKTRLGLRMGLSAQEVLQYRADPHGNEKFPKEGLHDHFQQITIDTFSIISEPHHYALLELMKTENFTWDRKWIAKRLQKTVSEIDISLERLKRVGLLQEDDKGQLVDSTSGFSTDIRDGLSSDAQRQFQQKSLAGAIEAIQVVPPDLRDNTSMTMAIHSQDLQEARRMIRNFRRKFCVKMEANPLLDEVYQLTISFVPLTQHAGDLL